MPQFLDEVEECVPALRRYARALTHDSDLADDLVQDCLERAIRKSALWRPSGPLRAWLFRILLNIYRNDLRRRRRSPDPLPFEKLASEPQALAAQPGRLALAETARAMQTLPSEQREALLLVAVEGMSYGEAAAVLGIPPGTLMSRLSRARTTLRRLTETGEPRLRTVK
jgi:RNA polymerase sigma-70 factor (ECF subfamily)